MFLILQFQLSLSAKEKTFECPQYQIIDIPYRISEKIHHPFDIEFGAIFHGPANSEMKVPGFYNGDRQFVLRFSPPVPVQWSFVTYSSLPELAGKHGVVNAAANQNPEQHGPIVIRPENPQHFFYADSTPYFLIAFEVDWLFALDWDNPKAIPRTKTLVDQMAANGFNQAIMNVYAYDVSWDKDPNLKSEYDFSAPKTFPFGGTNDKPDFSTLNVAFFRHLDRVIHYLYQKNIAAHLMIYVWNKQVNWPEMYSTTDNLYFDYVIKRYQAFPNIIWDISKEALDYGRCDMNYIHERIRRVRRLDAFERLLTVHDYNYCSRFPEKVDFISIQSWTSGLYQAMNAIRQKHAQQPIFNIEHGGYEKSPYYVFAGDYTKSEICLLRNYECAVVQSLYRRISESRRNRDAPVV